MMPIVHEETQAGHVRISPDTTISVGLLLSIVALVIMLAASVFGMFARSDAALSREQAALSYLSKAEANERFIAVQLQMDQRFTGIEKSLGRIEEKLDKHSSK